MIRGFFKQRFSLPVDFYDIRLEKKETWSEIKVSNYPLISSLKVLTDAIDIIDENEFKNRINYVLNYTAKNLTKCISTFRDTQGLMCGSADTELHLGDDIPNYYMFADANYLEYLHHLIKNKKLTTPWPTTRG